MTKINIVFQLLFPIDNECSFHIILSLTQVFLYFRVTRRSMLLCQQLKSMKLVDGAPIHKSNFARENSHSENPLIELVKRQQTACSRCCSGLAVWRGVDRYHAWRFLDSEQPCNMTKAHSYCMTLIWYLHSHCTKACSMSEVFRISRHRSKIWHTTDPVSHLRRARVSGPCTFLGCTLTFVLADWRRILSHK